MPQILIPTELDPRHDLNDGGDRGVDDHGGRRPPQPPADKRTGGNGDGDNWEARPQGSRGPRERLLRARTGMFFALFAILMFFVALVSVFFVQKSTGHFDAYDRYINEWLPTVIPSILWLNTGLLLVSSISAELARRAMFHEHHVMDEWFGFGKPTSKRAALWLWVTLALGSLFLAGQWIAWMQLANQPFYSRSNPSSHYFYLITYSHAAHLFVGIAALIGALSILRWSRQFATRQVFVDGAVWYWHAMGVLWIALFTLLEWGQ